MRNVPLLVDTNAAAVAVARPASTVRRWAHEGRLAAHGRDRKGRKLYDLAAVQAVAAALHGGEARPVVERPAFDNVPMF